MSRRVPLFLMLFLVLGMFLPVVAVWANAAPPEAAGGGSPNPQGETHVRMVREQVDITLARDGARAQVEGIYVMRNEGAQTEKMDVLYPLRLFVTQCEGTEIANLRVWVNDRAVTTRRIQGAPRPAYCDQPTSWAAFPVTFPPGQDVRIRVRYEQETWGYPPYLVLTYILETGAGWYGTIGQGEIRVHLPYPALPETIPLSEDFWGYGRGITPGAQLEGNTVRWVFQDLEPTPQDNIFLLFLQPKYWQEIERRRQAVRRDPNDGEAWGFLGLAIKKALLLPAPGFPLRTEDEGAQRLLQEALDAYQKAVTLKPRDADWHYGYGELLIKAAASAPDPARRAAYLEKGAKELQTALALKPNHTKTREFLNEWAWLLEGWVRREGDQWLFPGLTATPTFVPTPTSTALPSPTAVAAVPASPTPSPSASPRPHVPAAPPATPTVPAPPPASPSPPRGTFAAMGAALLMGGCCGLALLLVAVYGVVRRRGC